MTTTAFPAQGPFGDAGTPVTLLSTILVNLRISCYAWAAFGMRVGFSDVVCFYRKGST